MSLNAFNTLLRAPKYSESDFAHLNARQLGALAVTFFGAPSADPTIEPLRLKYVEGKTKDQVAAFRIFILGLKTKKQAGMILQSAGIEESAQQKGSSVTYTKTDVVVRTKAGEVTSFRNSVVPEPEIAARPYCGVLINFIARTTQISESQIEATVPENPSFRAAFNVPRAVVSSAGMSEFGVLIRNLIHEDAYWKTLSAVNKAALTGNKYISFISRFVNTCPWEVYFAMHTFLLVKALRVFSSYSISKKKLRLGFLLKYEGVPIVDQKFYMFSHTGVPDQWELKGDALKGAKQAFEKLKCVGIYIGGAPKFQVTPPLTAPKLVDARKSITDGEALRGGVKSAIAVLSHCDGYSGVPTASTRDLQYFFSAALSAVLTYKFVDIHLPSVGYLDNMISTLSDRRVLLGIGSSDSEAMQNVKLILSHEKLPSDQVRRQWCLSKPRDGAHQVLQSYREVPHLDEKTSPEVLEEESKIALAAFSGMPAFTALCYNFGPYAWTAGYHVYRYGRNANFSAIVTTSKKFSMLGISFQDKTPVLEELPCEKCLSVEHFYTRIIAENCFRNGSFLCPSAHYSSISNVPVIQTKGIALTESDAFNEASFGVAELGFDDREAVSDDEYDDAEGSEHDAVPVAAQVGEEDSSSEEEDPLPVMGSMVPSSFVPPVTSASTTSSTSSASTSTTSDPPVSDAKGPKVKKRGRVRPPPAALAGGGPTLTTQATTATSTQPTVAVAGVASSTAGANHSRFADGDYA